MKKNKLNFRKVTALVFIFGISLFSLPQSFAEYSYAKEISAAPVYEKSFEAGVGASIPDTPIGVEAGVEAGDGFVGTMKNCSWAIAKCDQSKVGFERA